MLDAIGVLEGGVEGGLMPRPPRLLPLLPLRLLLPLRRVEGRAEELRRVVRGVLVAAGSTSGVTVLATGSGAAAGLALAATLGWEGPVGVAPAAAAAVGPGDATEGLGGVAMAGGWRQGSWNVQSAESTLN